MLKVVPRASEAPSGAFKEWLRRWAGAVGSDGCTDVPDIHVDCCYQHDHAYQTKKDARSVFEGAPLEITKAGADAQFRRCLQEEDPLGRWSPISWIYWLGVRLFGHGGWSNVTNG